MQMKQRFSLRKKTIGVVSVLLGFWIAGAAGHTVTFAETGSSAVEDKQATTDKDGKPSKDEDAASSETDRSTTTRTSNTDAVTNPSNKLDSGATSSSNSPANTGTNTTATSPEVTVADAASTDVSVVERPSEVTAPTQGNVMVGVEGTFVTPDKEAILKRLNEIRQEAFKLGLVDRYVPAQWSDSLEKAAMTRSAEAALTIDHKRLSDKSLWTAAGTASPAGESLAWNFGPASNAILRGIEQWYEEKEEYIKTRQWSFSTGHYIGMINPDAPYTGLAAFGGKFRYPFTVTQWIGETADGATTATPEHYGKTIQLTEATPGKLTDIAVADTTKMMNVGSTTSVDMTAAYHNDEINRNFPVSVTEGFTWTSSNPSVATVVDGNIKALSTGKSTITVSLNGKSFNIVVTVIDAANTDLSTLTTTTNKEVPFKTIKNGDPNLEKDVRKTVVEGKNGVTKVTTSYSLDSNGKLVKHVVEEEIIPVVNKEINVGFMSTIVYKQPIQYIADDTLAFGVKQGSDYKNVGYTSTNYYYDGGEDKVVSYGTYDGTRYTATKVRVGVKPTTTVEEVAFETTYQADPALALNMTKEITAGINGKKTTTTTYKLDGDHAVVDKVTPNETKAVNRVIAVGTKPDVTTSDVDYLTTYVADATLAYGKTAVRTKGVKGTDTTSSTYKLDGNKAVADKVTTTRTKEPVTEVIAVGTKPDVTTSDVDYLTTYVADATLAYGKTAVRTKGVKGTDTTSSTYKLNGNAAVADKVTTTRTKEPVTEVIAVGTQTSTATKDVDYPTTYVADDTLAYGKTAVRTKGVKGSENTTTTYKLDGNAAVADKVTTTRTKEPVTEVIAVGTQTSTATKDVDYPTTYVADDTLAYGKTAVRTKGVKGSENTTTTYKLDGNAAVADKVTTTRTKEPVTEVIAVGTQTSTATKDVDYPTTYVADDTLAYGKTAVRTKGVKGSENITTTYKLDGNAAVADKVTTTRTKEPVTEVVAVGYIKHETIQVPFTTKTIQDDTLDRGQRKLVITGQNGTAHVVTTYAVNPITGSFENGDAVTTILTQAVEEVVAEGTKEVETPSTPTQPTPPTNVLSRSEKTQDRLPNTGVASEITIFGAAATAIITGLGLTIPTKRQKD